MIPVFNPDSPSQLAILLYGGTVKEEAVEPVIENGIPALYKTGKNKGQIKTHKVVRERKIEGLGLTPTKKTPSGKPSTDDEVLSILAEQDQNEECKEICSILLKIRELNKLINTYYTSVEELIYDNDSCVHPHFSHVSTDTGRLSCSKPNVQNQPTAGGGLVQAHFISRFDKSGCIVSADYSGLEVRIEAQLSGDEGYIKDINDGVDIHTKNLSLKKRVSYEVACSKVEQGEWEYERKKVKPFTFVMQYGGGVAAVAKKSGMSEDEVKDLLEARKKAFPRLYLYYDYLADIVNKQGWYKDPWGRRYAFKKYPAPGWLQKKGIKENYSPTEVKNYRTQGHSTANIVPVMLGVFWRTKALLNRDKYLLINTVHDSVMLDCKKEYINQAVADLKILENVNSISEKHFNYNFKVKIEIDISYGESWASC